MTRQICRWPWSHQWSRWNSPVVAKANIFRPLYEGADEVIGLVQVRACSVCNRHQIRPVKD